jgi:hypothetical protein
MAMSNSISAMPRLRMSANYVSKWIEALPDSVSVQTSSSGFFGTQGSV